MCTVTATPSRCIWRWRWPGGPPVSPPPPLLDSPRPLPRPTRMGRGASTRKRRAPPPARALLGVIGCRVASHTRVGICRELGEGEPPRLRAATARVISLLLSPRTPARAREGREWRPGAQGEKQNPRSMRMRAKTAVTGAHAGEHAERENTQSHRCAARCFICHLCGTSTRLAGTHRATPARGMHRCTAFACRCRVGIHAHHAVHACRRTSPH